MLTVYTYSMQNGKSAGSQCFAIGVVRRADSGCSQGWRCTVLGVAADSARAVPACCLLPARGRGGIYISVKLGDRRGASLSSVGAREGCPEDEAVCAQTRVHDRRFERLGRAVGSASPVLPAETAVFSASGWPSSSSTSFRKKQQKTAGPWPRTSPELGWRPESDGGLESAGVQHLSYALPQSTRAISRPVARVVS